MTFQHLSLQLSYQCFVWAGASCLEVCPSDNNHCPQQKLWLDPDNIPTLLAQTEMYLERLTGAQLAAFGCSQTDLSGTPRRTSVACHSRGAPTTSAAAGCDASTQLRDVELPGFDEEVCSATHAASVRFFLSTVRRNCHGHTLRPVPCDPLLCN